MTDQCNCGVYFRVGTQEQADPLIKQKLEAVHMLQELGYKVAVAPVGFSGGKDGITPLPSIIGLAENDPAIDQARSILFGDHPLVINGMEADNG